jgi:hypothetical protein
MSFGFYFVKTLIHLFSRLLCILLDNTLIKIWMNVGTQEALQYAESILHNIRYPDSLSFLTLIHGWSRTRLPEAGYRAHDLFKERLQLPPNRDFNITILCNSVISVFAKSGEQNVPPQQVESLLAQLKG